MNHLHLLIPALFPPQDLAAEVCAGLSLPALQKMLARGKVSAEPAIALEDWLCQTFGVQAVAPVRAAADGLDAGAGYWLCADPVHLQMQYSEMVLVPDVALKGGEAAAMCDTLNAHFADSGMKFFAPHPLRWYVQLQKDPQLVTTPLPRVAWCDARLQQPRGADALQWQRIITEVQMLMHTHPNNQARAGWAVSSLWLWGGGRAEPLCSPFDMVGGDSAVGHAFAQSAGVRQSAALSDMLHGTGASGLWLSEAMSNAQRRGDYHQWREAVQRFDQDCALVWHALRAGRLRRLTLEVLGEHGSQCFELTRASAWKFWLHSRSLLQYAV